MRTSPDQATPATLLERLRGGSDARAWGRFVELYTPVIFSWVRRLGLDSAEADDAVQDVFLLLSQKLPAFRYDPGQRFRGWLWTVVRNNVRDRCRGLPDAADGAEVLATDQVTVPDPLESWAELEYRRNLVGRALKVMKSEFEETTWRACWEYVAQDRPAAEVAKELGVSVDVVYQAKTRVLRRLKRELDGLLE